jgi:phenylalanyl-tRNA synthetase beta chain
MAPREWHGSARQIDVFDARADAEAALAALGVKLGGVQVQSGGAGWFHPGRRGQLVQGRTVLASFGEIHPEIADAYGLRGRVAGFEIHIDDVPMPKSKGPARALLSLSVYQPVTRDFAFIVDSGVTAGDLLKAVKSGAGPLLTDMQVFDLYEGANIGDGRKSIAVSDHSDTHKGYFDRGGDRKNLSRDCQDCWQELWCHASGVKRRLRSFTLSRVSKISCPT